MTNKYLMQHARKVAFLYDWLMVPCAWLAAYLFRYNLSDFDHKLFTQAYYFFPVIFAIQVISFYYFGLYRGMWRFASMPDLIRIIKSIFCAVIISAIIGFAFNRLAGIPRTVFPLYALILLFTLGGARLFIRWLKSYRTIVLTKEKKVLMIGVNALAESFIRESNRGILQHYKVLGIISLDGAHLGREIHGIRVLGKIDQVIGLVEKFAIDLVVIAQSEHAPQLKQVLNKIEKLQKQIRLLPNLEDIVAGKLTISDLKEINIEALLGRNPVIMGEKQISDEINSKCVLVTGGAGSIGSELVAQIIALEPAKLIIVDHSEYNLYSILQRFKATNIIGSLIDVKDETAIKHLLKSHKPDIIFHAAAYKHVPMLEQQTKEAVNNNIIGTFNLGSLSTEYNVKKFVLVSTDKAVKPTNIMGATKRISEMLCQALNTFNKTKFITVRFGNVLGSRGSVVPLFKAQIASGGPVTVTHPEITRYFMTIPEACHLILQASVMGMGSEIFVLDMGEPIKITALAEQMIRLSGKEPNKEIDIKFTGLRPGEKLHEELFYVQEVLEQTQHKKIHKASFKILAAEELLQDINLFKSSIKVNDETALLKLIYKFVPTLDTFHTKNNININSTIHSSNTAENFTDEVTSVRRYNNESAELA